MNLFWKVVTDMKPVEFHGHVVDMADLTDNWTVGKSEAEYRLWKLTRAPLDEVTACVELCFEEHSAERKAAERLVEVLATQHCPECGKRFSRELQKCPHCEQIAFEKMQKALKQEKRIENFNRFKATADKVVAVVDGLWRVAGFILMLIFVPLIGFLHFCDKLTTLRYPSYRNGYRRKKWRH